MTPLKDQSTGRFQTIQSRLDRLGFEILSPELPRGVGNDLVVLQETTFDQLLDRVLADAAEFGRLAESEDVRGRESLPVARELNSICGPSRRESESSACPVRYEVLTC